MATLLRNSAAFFAATLTLIAAASGCGGNSVEDNCSIFCDKSVECQGATDKAACMSICQKQAEDEAYADALDLQSECYEESTCSDIQNGFCAPKDL